jgi:hypothetical protein
MKGDHPMANQTYSNVSLLTFLHPILDKLSEGKVIRNSIAFALQVLGILNVVAGIYLIVEILKAAFRIESTGATIGGLLFVLFVAASALAIQQICSYRARSIRELGDSPFTVIPIFSILMRATGEMLAVSWLSLGVGGCLLLWFGGDYLLSLIPMARSSSLFGLDSGESSFLAGIVFLLSNGLLAFLALIFFYFFAEAVCIGADIARNVRHIVLRGGNVSNATTVEGSAASPHPFPVTEQSSVSVDFSTVIAPLTKWVAANKLFAAGIAGAAVLLFAMYKLFLQADPVKDGKRVAEAYCDCSKAQTERVFTAQKELLAKFDQSNFKTQGEAQSKLALIESEYAELNKCNSEAAALYNKKRSSYVGDESAMEEFDAALIQQQGLCSDENAPALNDTRAQLSARISVLPLYAREETPPSGSEPTTLESSHPLIGRYFGTLDRKRLELVIDRVEGTSVSGYNIAGRNNRPIQGSYAHEEGSSDYRLVLREPGDDRWDGEFTLTATISGESKQISGRWKAYQRAVARTVQVSNQESPSSRSTVASSVTIAFITGDGVRLRSEPSTEGVIITKFGKGTQVEVLEWLEGWVRIRCQGYEGYVSADFVRR